MLSRSCFNVIGFVFIFSASLPAVIIGAECKDLPKWLEVREVVFQVVDPTEKYSVKVEIPEVAKLECSASELEYGTDYFFTLKRGEPVTISYYKDSEDNVSRSTEMAGTLAIHSVLLGVEREKTPHYLEVKDEELEVVYRIFLAKEKGPAHVERKGNKQKLKILSWK